MTPLEKYYNKFNEDHRLETRHGQVEFNTSLKFIHDYLKIISQKNGNAPVKIADIGAGTGRYSIQLCSEGYDVTAVELVKRNLEVLRSHHTAVKTWNGDARNLSFLEDETFDLTIMFGPCYHLHGDEEKMKALNEAKRITKKGGVIMVAYVMNEYSVLSYCFGKTFGENKISKIVSDGGLDESFHIKTTKEDLYDYVRISDIDRLNEISGLKRLTIFSPDGPSDYMRRELNAMDEESFSLFKQYVISISERQELIGSGSHVVDVLEK